MSDGGGAEKPVFDNRRTRERASALVDHLLEWVRPRASNAWSVLRPLVRTVRPLGWVVLAAAFVTWLLGVALGWLELMTLAGIFAALVVLCALFLFGRQAFDISIEVQPARVTVGERAAGLLTVSNSLDTRLLSTRVELVVGAAAANFDIPSLGPQGRHEDLFQISTERRGVITVGPARLIRADPLGLFVRVVSQSAMVNLYVHPVTVRVPGVGPGFLRDLEGVESVDLSPSDLAFHSLREYVPGDDRRHVHWKTSARSGRLMVQQFVDTRRSHVVLVVDDAESRYVDSNQFELAVSIAGSLGVRSILDEQICTLAVGTTQLPTTTRSALLDALSGVDNVGSPDSLERSVALVSRIAQNASIVVLVTGPETPLAEIRRVARRFSVDVRIVAVRVGNPDPALVRVRNILVLNIERLDDLPRITNMAVKL